MDKSKKELLSKLFSSFENGIRTPKAERPRKYLAGKSLDYKKLGLGFNSGQFHHRESDEFKQSYVQIGVLKENPRVGANKKGRTPYTCFGAYGIIYPLKDEWGEVVNLYADRFKMETPKRAYLYNDVGVYPCYPSSPRVKTLFLCFDIEQTASLLQSEILLNDQAVIALHEGKLSDELLKLITERKHIDEIIILSSNKKRSPLGRLQTSFPERTVLAVELAESVNVLLQNKEVDKLIKLVEYQREAITLTNSEDKSSSDHQIEKGKVFKTSLEHVHEQKIVFQGELARIEILGRLPMDLSTLKVSLRLVNLESGKVQRIKLDLFELKEIDQKVSSLTAEYSKDDLLRDLYKLTSLLEEYREDRIQSEFKADEQVAFRELSPSARKEAMSFLTEKNLLLDLNDLIEKSGIVGEEQSRLTTFIIASSYKMPYPLHGLIQASSGNGKSHLINSIAKLMPSEDVVNLTRITSRSLYNYQKDQLMYKLILIQDEEGLDEESLFAFRELQSAGFLSSSTSQRNSFGKQQSRVMRVESHFASLMATTKTEVYSDNESRSIIMGIDESDEQTKRIITYSNLRRAGLIDSKEAERTTLLLRNVIRLMKPKEVINPYAHLITLPLEAKSLRRLNNQFQDFIAQITLLHQFQRDEDKHGRVISTIEDIKHAIGLFFSCIMLKVDELDASSRQFYDRLKEHVLTQPKGKQHTFSRREIRVALRMKKTKTAEFINLLLELEYIHIESGSANRGYNYQVTEWDEGLSRLQERIKGDLNAQLLQIERSLDK